MIRKHSFLLLLIIFCNSNINSSQTDLTITYKHNPGYRSPSISCLIDRQKAGSRVRTERIFNIRTLLDAVKNNPNSSVTLAALFARYKKRIPFRLSTQEKKPWQAVVNHINNSH